MESELASSLQHLWSPAESRLVLGRAPWSAPQWTSREVHFQELRGRRGPGRVQLGWALGRPLTAPSVSGQWRKGLGVSPACSLPGPRERGWKCPPVPEPSGAEGGQGPSLLLGKATGGPGQRVPDSPPRGEAQPPGQRSCLVPPKARAAVLGPDSGEPQPSRKQDVPGRGTHAGRGRLLPSASADTAVVYTRPRS